MLVGGGLLLGVLGALALARVLEDQVFGVRTTDPLVLTMVSVGTAIVALLACVSPAQRAARVDPLNVLSEQ
jgi:ABC-type lipoprotein release transport system permease subunit